MTLPTTRTHSNTIGHILFVYDNFVSYYIINIITPPFIDSKSQLNLKEIFQSDSFNSIYVDHLFVLFWNLIPETAWCRLILGQRLKGILLIGWVEQTTGYTLSTQRKSWRIELIQNSNDAQSITIWVHNLTYTKLIPKSRTYTRIA